MIRALLIPDPSDRSLSLDGLAASFSDPRPFPSEDCLEQLGRSVMTEVLDVVLDSPLEDQASLIAEAFLSGLHAGVQRLERRADRRRDALAEAVRDFDGSEVQDQDLQERHGATAAADLAVRAMELVRDAAARVWATASGEAWAPARGGVRATTATAAQIDAAEALRARQARSLAESDPGDCVVAFRGAPAATTPEDASRIFDALNWALTEWPGMSLALTGAPGADQIAKRWASQKKVRLVLARADFERHGRAAPFRANDLIMAFRPICVLVLAASVAPNGGARRPFGPALSLASAATAAGVRCVRVAPRPG